MKSLRIQNLKSIKDTGEIELKPLTVLIGKNSSGKSTFIRTLPLMKQSTSKLLSAPILWYGDYVDFGSFENSINDKCDKNKDCIVFTFKYNLSHGASEAIRGDKEVSVSIYVSKDIISKYVFASKEGNYIVLKHTGKKRNYEVFFENEEKPKFNIYVHNALMAFFRTSDDADRPYSITSSLISDEMINDAGLKNQEKYRYSFYPQRIVFKTLFDDKKRVTEAKKILNKLFENVQNKDFYIDKYLEEVSTNMLKREFQEFINLVGEFFTEQFYGVQYFQPIRSRGDRFYRVQGLNINSVDSDGVNAPMILYSLGEERTDFEKWCEENLGFKYLLDDFNGSKESASVYVSTGNNIKHNLTDVGFGYSQIFPIVLDFWMEHRKNKRLFREQTIIIEQPELHLHPAFQKKIISLMIKIIKVSNNSINFIIETHSETIINYIGKMVRENVISNKDINLQLVDKINDESVFRKIEFDEEGLINDWPIGFFTDEE